MLIHMFKATGKPDVFLLRQDACCQGSRSNPKGVWSSVKSKPVEHEANETCLLDDMVFTLWRADAKQTTWYPAVYIVTLQSDPRCTKWWALEIICLNCTFLYTNVWQTIVPDQYIHNNWLQDISHNTVKLEIKPGTKLHHFLCLKHHRHPADAQMQ